MGALPLPLHMSKRYHRAKFPLSLRSAVDFLSGWETNPYDEELEDPISWTSQSEHFGSVSRPLPEMKSILDIMREVPVVCRTITLCKPLYPGLKMNPWLCRVQTLPTIVRFISTRDFIHFKNKLHDKELINCAMLVTKHPSGSILGTGCGKHMSSYLLSGDTEMYHPDADLATWSIVVVHILTQPSRASWMDEELLMIEEMHSFVYRSPASSWAQYLRQARSEDFRLCLVTKSVHLPLWSQCPHLNKFLLACFLLRGKLSPAQMESRRDAAVQEFFGRMCTPELLTCFYEGQFDKSVEEILESVPMPLKPNLRETVRGFLLNLERYNYNAVPMRLREPNQDTLRNGHQNLSCATIVHFFKNICPTIGELTDDRWRKLLDAGMHVQDSYRRNTTDDFVLPKNKILSDLRAKLKQDVRNHMPRHVLARFQREMGSKHRERPILVSEAHRLRFLESHGRDLKMELDLNDKGFSRVACMCPRCPFFAKPLGVSVDGNLAQELKEHMRCYEMTISDFAFLKTVYLDDNWDNNFMRITNLNNVLNEVVQWDEFQSLFV
jgi:hypothetical protein